METRLEIKYYAPRFVPLSLNWWRLALVVAIWCSIAEEPRLLLNMYGCRLDDQIPFAPDEILADANNKSLVNFAGYLRYKRISPETGHTLDTKYLRIMPFFVGHLERPELNTDDLWIVFFCGSLELKFKRTMNGTVTGSGLDQLLVTRLYARTQLYKFRFDLNFSHSQHYECRGTISIPLVAQPYFDSFVEQYNDVTLFIEELDLEFNGEKSNILERKFSKPVQNCAYTKRIIPHQHHYLLPREPLSTLGFEAPEKDLITSSDELLMRKLSDKLHEHPRETEFVPIPANIRMT